MSVYGSHGNRTNLYFPVSKWDTFTFKCWSPHLIKTKKKKQL